MANPPPLHFAVPVWGDAYVDVFLGVALPAQLSANNIPALPHLDRCLYNIYTTIRDAPRIRASAPFARLSALMPTEIRHIDAPRSELGDDATWGNRYRAKSDCYRDSIARAASVDAANVLLNADIVLADGFLRRSAELLAAGKRVIELPAPRAVKPDVEAILHEAFRGSDGVSIDVSPRKLAALWVDHMHPLMKMHLWEECADTVFHPSQLFWRVGKSGVLLRCFHIYPIVVHPRNHDRHFTGTIDADLVAAACPDLADSYVATDSDELFAIELSDLDHYVGHLCERRTIREVRVAYHHNGDARNLALLRFRVRIKAGDENPLAWWWAIAKSEWLLLQLAGWRALSGIRRYLRAKLKVAWGRSLPGR
jgi:hypothetical protein